MNEMQDKELDDLFRKTMAEPEIPFDPEAWKAMESKLDAEDHRRTFYFRMYTGVVAGIFLLAGSLFFLKNQQHSESLSLSDNIAANKPHTSSASSVTKPTEHIPISEDTKPDYTSVLHSDNNTGQHHTISQKTYQDKQATTDALEASGSQSSSVKNTVVRTKGTHSRKSDVGQQYLIADQKKKSNQYTGDQHSEYETAEMNTAAVQHAMPANQANVSGKVNSMEGSVNTSRNSFTTKNDATNVSAAAVVNNADPSSNNTNATINANTNIRANTTDNNTRPPHANIGSTASAQRDSLQQPIGFNPNTIAADSSISGEYAAHKSSENLVVAVLDSIPEKTDSLTHADTSSVKDKIKKEPYKRGFSMSLIVNPEYNSPVDFSFYKPGVNIGLNVEYYILPRVSIVSGIIYGKKLYACDASDYASSPSYMRYGKNYYPEYVKASCGVLDIPVNIRYKFLNKKSFNVYAATGLSSYIMLKEKYVFEYPAKSHRAEDEQQITNKNRYLFNIWNVSLGVEKRITDKWSVQAEPYVKIPLSGIGAGDIKLVSTGIYFSLKYYFK